MLPIMIFFNVIPILNIIYNNTLIACAADVYFFGLENENVSLWISLSVDLL